MKKLLGKGKVIVSAVSVFAILAVSLLSVFTGTAFVASADTAEGETVTYPIGGKYDADVVKTEVKFYSDANATVKTEISKFTDFDTTFIDNNEGDGTARRPYIIKTANQFAAVACGQLSIDTTDKFFKVDETIKAFDLNNTETYVDCSGTMTAEEVKEKLTASNVKTSWKDPDNSKSFKGIFDGNGVVIYGLRYDGVTFASLFPKYDSNAIVRNVTVKNCYFSGTSAAVLFARKLTATASKLTVLNSSFYNNYVEVTKSGSGVNETITNGGIISAENSADGSTLSVENVLSYGNIAKHKTQSITYALGGRFHASSGITATNCIVMDNAPYAIFYGSTAFNSSTYTNVYTNMLSDTAWTNVEGESGGLTITHTYKYGKDGKATYEWKGSDESAIPSKYERTFAADQLIYADYAGAKASALKDKLGDGWSYNGDGYPTPRLYSPKEYSMKDAWSGEIACKYFGGEGTSSSPYVISTAEEFALMLTTAKRGQYFKLNSDININDTTKENWTATAKNWFTSNDVAPFVATLDGNGHTVNGLYYDGSQEGEYVGLIPVVDFAANVKNLIVKNSYIKAQKGAAGAVSGAVAERASKVIYFVNIAVDDTVVFDGSVTKGGIVGRIGYSVVRMNDCISETNGLFGELTGEAKVTRCVSVNAYPFGTTDGVTATYVYTDTNGTAIDGLTVLERALMIGDSKETKKAMKKLDFNGGTWVLVENDFPMPGFKEASSNGTPGEVWSGVAAAGCSGGSGTEEDPWLISTGEELAYCVSKAKRGSKDEPKYYKLTADIYLNDVNSKMWEEKVGCNEWYNTFNAEWENFRYVTLDGNGYVVYGLYYGDPDFDYVRGGLIPQASAGTVVKNLGISEAYLYADPTNESNAIGAIFGLVRSWYKENELKGLYVLDTHDGASNKAVVTQEAFIEDEPKIINCFVDHTCYCETYNTGGFIGTAWGPVYMEDCIFTGTLNPISDILHYGTFMGDDSSYGSTYKNCVSLPLSSHKLWGGTCGATWRNASYVMTVAENVYYFASSAQNGGGTQLTKLSDPAKRLGTDAQNAMTGLDWEEDIGDGHKWRVVEGGTPLLASVFGERRSAEELEKFSSKEFDTPYVTVSFMTNADGVVVDDMRGQMYSKITLPIPKRDGYKFIGWHVFDDLTLIYPKDYFPPRDLTLYAEWESTGVVCDFEDYPDTYWDYDDTCWRLNKPGAKGGYKNAYVRNGGRSMHLLDTNTESADFLINYEQMLTPGKSYTISFWVATDKANNPATLLSLVHNSKPVYKDCEVGYENMAVATGLKVGEWVQYSYSFTAQTQWVSMRASAGSSLYFDDIVIGEIEGKLAATNLIGSPKTGDTITIAAMVSVLVACAVVAVISKKNLVEVID